MSLRFNSKATLFKEEVRVNTYGSSSPKDRFKIIPDNVKYGLNIKWLRSRIGMKWTELRKVIRNAFLSTIRDSKIIQKVKNLLIGAGVVPVRSGKLLDFILRTLKIRRFTRTSTRYSAEFTYIWPGDRPLIINNPAHSPPETGYGDWAGYKLQHNIPNVTIIRTTPFGNALYILNDPQALSDPRPVIDQLMTDELMDDFEGTFNRIIIQVGLLPHLQARGINP